MEGKKIKMKDRELEYKKGFKWCALAYSDIVQAYMRIEEVKGRLCCCVANFDRHFLMLKTGEDELVKVEASGRKAVEQILEELREKNPAIKIGYDK